MTCGIMWDGVQKCQVASGSPNLHIILYTQREISPRGFGERTIRGRGVRGVERIERVSRICSERKGVWLTLLRLFRCSRQPSQRFIIGCYLL